MNEHVLIIDGQNFLYRAWAGWREDANMNDLANDRTLCFNFFRNLRALVAQQKPTRVHIVFDGKPVQRLSEFSDYKANRRQPSEDEMQLLATQDPEKYAKAVEKKDKMTCFFMQKSLILGLLNSFPVTVLHHPQQEADDVIYNMIKNGSSAVPVTVVSNDSDFTQLLCQFQHVKVYNPMKKTYVVKPDYDYVSWKALRGDGTDNIPGVKGIGDKRATALIQDSDALVKYFVKNPDAKETFERNLSLIGFIDFDEHEMSRVTSSSPSYDRTLIRNTFEEWAFASILKTWPKYLLEFDKLWPVDS